MDQASPRRTLSRAEARAFYDRMGRKLESQAFYEDVANAELIAHGDFGEARAVLELGAGTGRLAERLLRQHLPAEARYTAVDQSETMVGLCRTRLAGFGERVRVIRSDGGMQLEIPSGSVDRFVSTYLLDLLSEADIAALLEEAHRVLAPGGRLGIVSLTHGRGRLERLVSSAWDAVHRIRPVWVGGCRPIDLAARLPAARWKLRHRRVVSAWGLASEVLLAEPAPGA